MRTPKRDPQFWEIPKLIKDMICCFGVWYVSGDPEHEFGEVHVHVASSCVHVNPQQALEVDACAGSSIILAYPPHISQGFPIEESIQRYYIVVDSGYWALCHYNPEAMARGNNPFQLDSKKIKGDLYKFLAKEDHFVAVMRRRPKHAQQLDDKLKYNLAQKNHLLQVLNEEDLEGQFHKLVEGLSDASLTDGCVEQAKTILMQDIMAGGLKARPPAEPWTTSTLTSSPTKG